MWQVIGFYYILVAPNMFRVLEIERFETPQACFAVAMEIMADNEDPRNLACLPKIRVGAGI